MPKAKHPPVVLTDAKIRALRPDPAGEYVQGDLSVPGFGVRVRPRGVPVYILAKRSPGDASATRISLGRVGDVSLAAARERAREASTAVRGGVEVNAEKRRAAAAKKAEREHAQQVEEATGFAPGTFGEAAERYVRTECRLLKRGADYASIIRRQLLPRWGDRPLDGLRRRDLTAVLDPLIAVEHLQAAHKLREVAIRVLNWVVDRGDLQFNALADTSRGRRRSGVLLRTRRDRVLTADEVKAVWLACDIAGQPFGKLIQMTLLLGQRREEVAQMEWAELDLGAGLWIIPAARYKTGIEHAVPLPDIAIDLIRSVPKKCDRWIFATRPGMHFRGFSKAKIRLDTLSGVTGWRVHDLRRTMRTGLAELRVDPDTAERVTGHVIGGIRGIYDRYSYLDEKREALVRWAAHLMGIVDPLRPDRVVQLRARGR
jgi:integrase